MEKSNIKRQNTFEVQSAKFEKLLLGAKMARVSTLILIAVSLILVYFSRDNTTYVMILLIGALAILFFREKFLSIKAIKQKSYTQTSLISSISKLKTYMANRKKYEMYFMAFWIITLTPSAATHFKSNITGIIAIIFYIAVVYIFGNMAYQRSDREISLLEETIKDELRFRKN